MPKYFFKWAVCFRCIIVKARITRERTEENASVRFLLEDFLLGPRLLVYGSVARHVEVLRSILRQWLGEENLLSKEIEDISL